MSTIASPQIQMNALIAADQDRKINSNDKLFFFQMECGS